MDEIVEVGVITELPTLDNFPLPKDESVLPKANGCKKILQQEKQTEEGSSQLEANRLIYLHKRRKIVYEMDLEFQKFLMKKKRGPKAVVSQSLRTVHREKMVIPFRGKLGSKKLEAEDYVFILDHLLNPDIEVKDFRYWGIVFSTSSTTVSEDGLLDYHASIQGWRVIELLWYLPPEK